MKQTWLERALTGRWPIRVIGAPLHTPESRQPRPIADGATGATRGAGTVADGTQPLVRRGLLAA